MWTRKRKSISDITNHYIKKRKLLEPNIKFVLYSLFQLWQHEMNSREKRCLDGKSRSKSSQPKTQLLDITHSATFILHFNLCASCRNNWGNVLCNVAELCPLTHFQLPRVFRTFCSYCLTADIQLNGAVSLFIFHIQHKVCGEQTVACCFLHSPVGQTRYSMWLCWLMDGRNVCTICDQRSIIHTHILKHIYIYIF